MIFDRYVLALDEPAFPQTVAKRGHEDRRLSERRTAKKPITGIAGCCGSHRKRHAADPPSSVIRLKDLQTGEEVVVAFK